MSAAADPIARLALALGGILVAARAGGEIAKRAGMPQVLGEIVAGIALRALPGTDVFADLGRDASLDVLARLGALLLLFDAGLALAVRDVLRAGAAASRVAILGTVGSVALGLGAATLALPGAPLPTRAYLAGALGATSVGVGARVLKDLGKSRAPEAKTILGAAVIDDVIGLVVLSLASGWAAGDGRAIGGSGGGAVAFAVLVAKTAAFFAASLYAGPKVARRTLALAARLQTRSALVVTGLVFCFGFAWAADAIGLAPIVGAFTAGLVLEEPQWRPFTTRGERGLDEEVEPIGALLVPLFFVLLGLRTDLHTLADPRALALAFALTAAAILGKLACGAGASRGSNRLAVAFGMMPRGEVTLVFASLGSTLGPPGRPVVDAHAYSALVMVVVVTTLVTPVALKWSFARSRAPAPDVPASARP